MDKCPCPMCAGVGEVPLNMIDPHLSEIIRSRNAKGLSWDKVAKALGNHESPYRIRMKYNTYLKRLGVKT